MDLDYFNVHWKRLAIISSDLGGMDRPLESFLKSCAGHVKGGLLFYGKNDYEGEVLILKCDEEMNCYKRVSNTDDDDKDWQLIGYLVDMHS